MQAAASIPLAVLPQAGLLAEGPPKQAAPAGWEGASFTELFQRGLEQSAAPGEPLTAEWEEALPPEPETDPSEEAAERQAAGMVASLLGQAAAAPAESPASGEPALEGLEGPAGAGESPAAAPRPEPKAAAREPARGVTGSFQAQMVQEKIARILQDEAAPAERAPEAAEPDGAPAGDPAPDEAPEAAPEALQAPDTVETGSAPRAITPAGRELESDAGQTGAGERTQARETQGVPNTAEAEEGRRTRAAERAAERVPPQTARIGPGASEMVVRAQAAERALMRFADDLREMRTGVREIRITLEPESLGELTISVRKTEDGLSARIFSPDRQVCSAVAEQLPLLQSAIEQSGLTMRELEIVYTPSGFQESQAQQGGSGRQGRGRPSGRRALEALAGDEKGAFWSGFYLRGLPEDATVVYRI